MCTSFKISENIKQTHILNYINTRHKSAAFYSLIFSKFVANSRKQFRYVILSKYDDNSTKYNTNFIYTFKKSDVFAARIVTEQVCQQQTLAGNVPSEFHAEP